MAAQEYLQAVISLYAVSDAAAGMHVHDLESLNRLGELFERLEPGTWDSTWALVGKYDGLLERLVSQNALIAVVSQWDWYIRRLGAFVLFAEASISDASSSADDRKQLGHVDRLPIGEQLTVLERATGISLSLDDAHRSDLKEMAAVRNIGMHNRWECDQRYLDSTPVCGFELGDLRLFDEGELQNWHARLVESLNETSTRASAQQIV
jgi:hypothetical protein